MVERESGDEDGLRAPDGPFDRAPHLVVVRRPSVLVVKREPNWDGAEKRARATVLITPCTGGFTRRTESQALVPRTRRTAGVRVAREDRDERDVGSGPNTLTDRSSEGVDAVVEVRGENGDAAMQRRLVAPPQGF
jgi:hypothetical protein